MNQSKISANINAGTTTNPDKPSFFGPANNKQIWSSKPPVMVKRQSHKQTKSATQNMLNFKKAEGVYLKNNVESNIAKNIL